MWLTAEQEIRTFPDSGLGFQENDFDSCSATVQSVGAWGSENSR